MEAAICYVLGSAACYAALFFGVLLGCCWPEQLSQQQRIDWSSRIASNVQCVISTVSAVHILFFDEAAVGALANPAIAVFGQSEARDVWMLLFIGYLVYDLMLVLHQLAVFPDWSVVVHHVLILTAWTAGLAFGWCTLYLGGLLINELSTPFINQRYILKHKGLTDSRAYVINGYLLIGSFLLFRIIACAAVVLHIGFAWLEIGVRQGQMWTLPSEHIAALLLLSIAAGVHMGINGWWFWRIIHTAMRYHSRPKDD